MSLNGVNLGVILLMAGQSKRMGANKANLPWQGATLACQTIKTLAEALPHAERVAVVGKDLLHGNYPFVQGYKTVYNACPEKGQAYSIRLGLDCLIRSYEDEASSKGVLHGILFSVCDQPLLDIATIRTLLEIFEEELKFDRKAIVVPSYEPIGKRGNPVIFSSYWAEYLAHLEGDQGGRQIIRGAGADHVVEVPVEGLDGWSRGFDVDTPEAYEKVYKKWGQENR